METNEPSKLDKLKEQVKKDLYISNSHTEIFNEILNHSNKYHRYLSLLISEKNTLKKINILNSILYGKLYERYRFDNKIKLKYGNEVKTFIMRDPEYVKLRRKFEQQELLVEYISGVLEIFKNRGFIMRNLVDMLKMESQQT